MGDVKEKRHKCMSSITLLTDPRLSYPDRDKGMKGMNIRYIKKGFERSTEKNRG